MWIPDSDLEDDSMKMRVDIEMLIEMQNARREMATRLEGAREEINKQLREQLNKTRAIREHYCVFEEE